MPKRTMSSPFVATRSQVSPVASPFRPGAAPTAVAPTGLNASHTPIEGNALDSDGAPVSSSACVTTVKMRLPRTGKLNQSVWPTWLKRPHHKPPPGIARGWASVPMASEYPPTAELAEVTVRVCVLPAERFVSEIALSVPEGVTCPWL